MTRNLSGAARCPECSGLVAAGRQCKRCAGREENARNKRDANADRDAAIAATATDAAAGGRLRYRQLRRHVDAVLAREGIERIEYMDRNPLEFP